MKIKIILKAHYFREKMHLYIDEDELYTDV